MNIYNIVRRMSIEYPEENLNHSSIVFSPHFDDETLGCGGTIIKKKHVGADIKIVFMTDGSKSHSHLISEDKLKAIRKSESLIVARLLGLTENDVFFLDYEETKLRDHFCSAVNKVIEILSIQKPDEIFVPYRGEPALWSFDHLATNTIVLFALQNYSKKVTVYEYPIWLWYSQPLTIISRPTKLLASLKQNIVSKFNLMKDFRSSIYIGDVLKWKHEALEQYKSQMSRLVPDPSWQILADISQGKFLKCFFQDYELFSQTVSIDQ